MKPAIKKILKTSETSAFLVSSLTNIRYLSGFGGTSAVILYHKLYSKPFFITDSRYTLIARKNIKGFKILGSDDVSGTISILCKNLKRATLGYNGKNLTCSSLSAYRKKIKNLCFKDCGDIIAEFRAVKTAEEIKKIRKAVTIADDIFLHIRRFIKPGLTEKEIKNRIDNLIHKSQAENASF
ncbi:MAG: aminopeptidase P family N-terminal domain-containing protein, partial [Candidatus Aureabacteria bacterium]|nr:aminopeptidase P family N-terminal domain-containing protein [Candidatus Auribacterota bacterium]